MPRKKLSEFRAKQLVHHALGLPYQGWEADIEAGLGQLPEIAETGEKFVVKVDQGVKGRFKKGLVLLDVTPDDLSDALQKIQDKGYRYAIIEPMVPHESAQERYLSFARFRDGVHISYSAQGGVDIESNQEGMQTKLVNDQTDWDNLVESTGFSTEQLKTLTDIFNEQHCTLLEINPYLAGDNDLRLLDLAIEVDDAGDYFVDSWTVEDFRRSSTRQLTEEEEQVLELDEKSIASFKLELINPNGAIWLLLSGGGASIVVADEVHNQGFGKQLANYGEYSGNPNTEESYLYTRAVLRLMTKSTATKKVLFIGGAVANFTDIANTFGGVIAAIDELADELKEQGVKVFVRRGGPRQEVGLAKIEACLKKHGLLGSVHSPQTPLTEVVGEALKEMKS